MKTENGFPEKFAVEMGIYFGGENGFMSEHFLDGPKIGTAFHQVGGKGMPEGMGTDVFFDAGFLLSDP